MEITSRKIVKNLLRNQSVQPLKALGQNFLIDKEALKKFIKEAYLGPQDTILEIGPGAGSLTLSLAKKTKMVVAVEKDSKMCKILNDLLERQSVRNVRIVNADILKWDPKNTIGDTGYKAVGNLPFYLTAPVIRKFLESDSPPTEMVLVVQKEVAQRIAAKPSNMNLLAVSVQFYGEPKIVDYISKKSFWPQPKVDAAIIKISNIKNEPRHAHGRGKREQKSKIFSKLFFKIVKAGFSHPRKQIANNLSSGLKLDKEEIKSWLLKNKINPERRAETLSLKNWLVLTKNF